jgi:hypothetical protein
VPTCPRALGSKVCDRGGIDGPLGLVAPCRGIRQRRQNAGSCGVGAPRFTFLFNLQPQSMFAINGVSWAMAAEVQSYLLLPALAWLTYALSSRTGPLKATVTLVGA